MRSSEKEKLLDDLLRDANYEAFRAEVFELSAAEFRGNQRTRSRHPALALSLGLAASVALIATVLFFALRTTPTERSAAPRRIATVATADATPLQKDALQVITQIETVPLEFVEVIRSLPDRNELISTPKSETIRIVRSNPAHVDHVNDTELLALFPNDAIGIIATQGKKLIVFTDAHSRSTFERSVPHSGLATEAPFAKPSNGRNAL